MPFTQTIDNLLGGVSQLAARLRQPNEMEESLNALHSLSQGYSKRPSTSNIAQLSSTPSDYTTPDVFLLDYGQGDKFYAAFIDGDLKVWDENGVAQAVSFPNGKAYLGLDLLIPRAVLSTFTAADSTPVDGYTEGPFAWEEMYYDPAGSPTLRPVIKNNRIEQVNPTLSSETTVWRAGLDLPNDMTVRLDATFLGSVAGSQNLHIGVRVDPTTGAGYYATLDSNDPMRVRLIKKVSWSDASPSNLTALTNTAYNPVGFAEQLEFSVIGTTLTLKIDGVTALTVVDATIATGSDVALYLSGATTLTRRFTVDNFTVEYESDNPENERLIRVAVMGDRTFVANRTVKVLRDSTQKAPVQTPTALIYIEQADYGTKYTVTLDGLPASYETPSGIDPSSRRLIATETIATELMAALTAAFSGFTFAQFGSIIRVQKTDGSEFRVSSTDGLADNGAKVLKGTVQRASDLPLRCIADFVLEVAGDPEQAKDNYWVKFDVTSADDYRGVWKECARPGEGIAFDASTLPHELVFSDEATTTMEAKGFPPLPVVSLVQPTAQTEIYSESQNDGGFIYSFAANGVSGAVSMPTLWDHDKDYFLNLQNANGGPIKLLIPYIVETQTMDPLENLTIIVEYNDGAASTNWTVAATKTFSPGIYQTDQLWEIDIAANIGANYDIRIRASYEGGVTPTKPGRVRLYPTTRPPTYYVYASRDLTWGTDTYYPNGTAWTVVADGQTANYTQTDDMTGAALAAAIEPLVEALTGVNSSVVTNANGTAIRITSTSNTPVTVTVSATFSSLVNFWNHDLVFTDDEFVGKTIRNLSDGSSGTITSNEEHVITVGALTGGVENKFRDGDLCVIGTGSRQLTFREVAWTPREAGDSITNPWPSFRDNFIRDLFVHRGRLGMLSGGNALFSEAAKPENFFRTATTQLLDADPIDISWAGGRNARFNSAVMWNEELVIFGDLVQLIPTGEPIFSPATAKLDLLSAYPSDPKAKPEVAGRFIFFGRPTSSKTLVHALTVSPRTQVAEAKPLTKNLPEYLDGEPIFMAADSALGYLFTVCNGDRSKLYHTTYVMEDDAAPLISWGTWTFQGDIMGMDVSDGTLALLINYADGLYLETLDLSGEGDVLLDRQFSTTGTYANPNTTWTLPYAVATDGSEGTVQVVQADGTVLTTTRPTSTTVRATGDFSGAAVSVGLRYTMEGTLSTLFVRRGEGQVALTSGRTQVARLKVFYDDPSAFTVSVTPQGRATRTYTADSAGEDGELSLPVGTRNSYATIVISNALPVPTRISGLEWEGNNYSRSQRA